MNTALIQIAINHDIFRGLVDVGTPVTAKEPTERTQADCTLLSRILRSLTVLNALDGADVETYLATKAASSFVAEKRVSNLSFFHGYSRIHLHV